MAEKIDAIDWESLKNGAILIEKMYPYSELLKLDGNKANYTRAGKNDIVEIKKYAAKGGDNYQYFQIGDKCWFPLTEKYWNIK